VSVRRAASPVQTEARRKVGLAAAALVRTRDGRRPRTGSTAAFAIADLGRRVREEKLAFTGVATSWSAAENARRAGIDVRPLNDVARVDLALDGADEVGPQLALIKGGGAAHTLEKVVATAAERFVVLVDDSKLVARLGEKWAVPVEVLAVALQPVLRALARLGAEPQVARAAARTARSSPTTATWWSTRSSPASTIRRRARASSTRSPASSSTGSSSGLADEALVGSCADGSVRTLR
jgi:ribose 5-phosphate isomerase A